MYSTLRVPALRDLLATRLPDYARPVTLTLVPALPLTPNGKLDRAALPTPAAPPAPASGTPTERRVAPASREGVGLPGSGPAPDSTGAVLDLVRTLSREDFGERAARIGEDGEILPPE